jgi:hypothetical protein
MEYNRPVGRVDLVPPDTQSFQLNVRIAVRRRHGFTGHWGVILPKLFPVPGGNFPVVPFARNLVRYGTEPIGLERHQP